MLLLRTDKLPAGPGWLHELNEFPALISEGLTSATKRRAIIRDIAGRFALNRVIDGYRKLESNPNGKMLVLPGLSADLADWFI